MAPHRVLLLLMALLIGLLVPAQALAESCTFPIREIGPLALKRSDYRRPVYRTVTRETWKLEDEWFSSKPWLNQWVKLRGGTRVHGISFKEQRALTVDARTPEYDHVWMYIQDPNPLNGTCTMVGKKEWEKPKFRIRQQSKEVRITATSRRTPGDTTGCLLGPDPALEGKKPCPNLARSIVLLKKPLGDRKLVFEQFPSA